MIQYTGSYSTPAGMAYFSNKIGLSDDFVVMQTGQYEYQCFVGDYENGNGVLYTLARTGTSSGAYTTTSEDVTGETFTYSNEYYMYSNVGLGQAYALPSANNYMVVLLGFLVVFEVVKLAFGGLFRWKRRF